MMDRILFLLTLVSALGCALVAGVFFAFSTFVMKALGRLPPAQGIAAMQAINVTVLNPWFMTVLFGTAGTCLAVAVFSLVRWRDPGAAYLLAGSLLYLLGTILVTIVFHVPRNDALAAVDPAGAGAGRPWARYLRSWTAGNHVRTAAALAAATSLLFGLCCRPGP